MQINRTVCIAQDMQSIVFNCPNCTYELANAIMQTKRIQWAEAVSCDKLKTKNIKTPADLQKIMNSGLSSFSCRLKLPNGNYGRITIDFMTEVLCLTCSPADTNMIIGLLKSPSKPTPKLPRRTQVTRLSTVTA